LLVLICTGREHAEFPDGTDSIDTLKERRGAHTFLNRNRTSFRFVWRWRRMAVCECNVVVAQTLSYPAQLATHRHPPTSPQKSDTYVHCRASIFKFEFSALCAPTQYSLDFLGENRRRIDRDLKSFSNRDWVP